ncbi:LOW QUALITY PROTEIN: hypothetical protein HID58_022331, partial [Brassica napus]
YSRSEKGKSISLSNKQSRRNLVVIPAENPSSLIKENKFTLIGVRINGLKPLEMMLDTTLLSGEIRKVELNYEKNIASYYIPSSMKTPVAPSNTSSRASHPNYRGINQTKTRDRSIALEDMITSSTKIVSFSCWMRLICCLTWYQNYCVNSIEYNSLSSTPCFTKTLGRTYQGSFTPRVWVEKENQSHTSDTPSPKPQREAMFSQEVNASQTRKPASQGMEEPGTNLIFPLVGESEPSPLERRSALQRLETSVTPQPLYGGKNNASQNRASALQRLTPPTERTLRARERISLPQVSPIRTLSEDRIHANPTRNASWVSENADPSYNLPIAVSIPIRKVRAAATKATGKRKMVEKPQSQSRKRVMQNPPRGVTIKKRKITKNSPKCKVSTNAVTT